MVKDLHDVRETKPEILESVCVIFADGSEGTGLWNGVTWWTNQGKPAALPTHWRALEHKAFTGIAIGENPEPNS